MTLLELRRGIGARARDWARGLGLEAPDPLPLARPPQHVRAELSLPWPLQAAKALKRPPLELAGELARKLEGLEGVESAQASPPGFVNLSLSWKALSANLDSLRAAPAAYGADPGAPKRSILIEFVSANPTGPLHLASGRAAALGDSLARILRRIGHKVGAEYYVNDAGRQVGLLGLSVKARHEKLHGRDAAVPEDGYQGEYVRELAAQAPADARGWDAERFSRFAVERLLATHKADMEAYGVAFDGWRLESELHARGAVQAALEDLKARGMAYEKEGALWLGTSAGDGAEDDKDRVLLRSDGRPTYFLADIAYHRDKYERGWEQLIDIWGADHHGYAPRMKAAVAALGKPPESFQVIIHQLVHLYRGKELVKMSKRAGEFVTLRELVEEAGRDACRFFFAQRTPNAHMNFDLELARKQSQENPVYYAQYVHARACSIFREAAKSGLVATAPGNGAGPSFGEPQERALLAQLLWMPETLRECERALSPHPLAGWLLELAGLFHPFYESCRVLDPSDRARSSARLALCQGVRDAMREGLGLLGVGAPESM